MTLGIRIGQELSRLRRGEIDREEFEKRAAQHLGALGGTLTGAGLGWSLGRAVPGLGAILGAFSGGLVGHLGGERMGRAGAERVSRVLVRDPSPHGEDGASPPEGALESEMEPPSPPDVGADD
jgi:phage tail tape-measure protein